MIRLIGLSLIGYRANMKQHKFQRMDAGTNRMTAQRTRDTAGREIADPVTLPAVIEDALRERAKDGSYLPLLTPEERPEVVAEAIKAYSQGVTIRQIAADYGVTRETLYSWILAEVGPERYSSLITRSLTSKIARADDKLESADSPLDLARARELARFSRMDLERRRPHLYGPKQEVTMNTAPILNITIATQHSPELDITPKD
jgi:transposase-like protein